MKSSIIHTLLLVILLFSCNKHTPEEQAPNDKYDTYGYQIECEACTIVFIDEKKETKSIYNPSGKVVIDFNLAIYHELEVSVTLNSNNVKLAKAAILKNGKPIKSYQSLNSFKLNTNGGAPIANPRPNPTTPSNPSTPSTPSSSVCGAKNKTGGYCKRKVVGGGRCWQHK